MSDTTAFVAERVAKSVRDVPTQALILAGGKGKRLYPYTATMPKPLLPVWDVPVVEVMIRSLSRQGIRDVTLAVNHLADLIVSYFGNGERFGAHVDHLREAQIMGTAGSLSLIPAWQGDILVTNGDIITDIDISAMYAKHRRTGAAITVASITREVRSNSGVLRVDGTDRLLSIEEKPVRHERISIGIYILNQTVLDHLVPASALEMPDLINRVMGIGQVVHVYHHSGIWLDIGNPDDYALAQSDEAIGALIRGLLDR